VATKRTDAATRIADLRLFGTRQLSLEWRDKTSFTIGGKDLAQAIEIGRIGTWRDWRDFYASLVRRYASWRDAQQFGMGGTR
jgi:hypothetical protein